MIAIILLLCAFAPFAMLFILFYPPLITRVNNFIKKRKMK